MKNLTHLLLACTLAVSSPIVLPATHAGAEIVQPPVRVPRLGAEFLTFGSAQQGVQVFRVDGNSVLNPECKPDDQIIEVNGTATPTMPDFLHAMDLLPPYAHVTFTIQRGILVFERHLTVP